ncbi:MAG: flagellar hook-associated protein 3 [Brevinematales bacterium]
MNPRVTQSFIVNDFNVNLKSRMNELQKTQNKLASGYRINLPSDDPVGTILYMDYEHRLKEVQTYQRIIEDGKARLNMIDSSLESATTIIQRLRELAIQGANGTYTKEDREKMAVEVDQLLRELLNIANMYYKDTPLFGGTTISDKPFKPQFKVDENTGIEYLENVRYMGNNQARILEVDRGERVDVTPPGNQIFWAENMEIYSTLNVSGYVAQKDSKILVDGVEIAINAGDNLEVIANKINDAGLAVKASIQTQEGQSYFALETTSPHQISLLDLDGGTVLQDLGIIDHGMYPPNNYSPAARVFTGSVFDVMINFRKALLSDNVFQIGGRAVVGIDNSLGNLLKYRAHMGAVTARLDNIFNRLTSDNVYLEDAKQNTIGTDIAKAMMDLKALEFSHDVALNVGARILPRTLLDFLR